MRFRLRTLLIVLALGPPVLALAWRALSTPELSPGVSVTGVATYLGAWIVLTVFWRRMLRPGRGGN